MGDAPRWLQGFFASYEVWATLISTSVGFAGVITAIVLQHRSDRVLADDARLSEKRRLVAAIRTELNGIVVYCAEGVKSFNDSKAEKHLFPVQQPFFVFDALAGKIDLLSEREIQAVTHCYLLLREVPNRLMILSNGKLEADGKYVPVPAQYFYIVTGLLEGLAGLATSAVKSLDERE